MMLDRDTICQKRFRLWTFGIMMRNWMRSLFLMMLMSGCDTLLEEEVTDGVSGDEFLTTEEGITSVLFASYAEQALISTNGNLILHAEEWSTDIEWEQGGGDEAVASSFINFTWDPSLDVFEKMWNPRYRAIRDVNIVLENLADANIDEEAIADYEAEAHFIRALSYIHLYHWFGAVPLRTSTADTLALSRATDETLQAFMESELLTAIPALPFPGEEAAYGRATAGAARAVLCKFYLNTKQWQKCADMAQDIIDMGTYALYDDYEQLFHVDHEQNDEFIFVHAGIPAGPGNQHMNGAFPTGFAKDPVSGLTFLDNWNIWARNDRLRDDFYNSFEAGDTRINPILTTYINQDGETISLLDDDNTRSFKYWPDPNAIGNDHGNDIPQVRYADILLARAEALNEIEGPQQASIDLINQVRNRAGLDDLTLAAVGTQDDLRDHILQERAWEFYTERKRRQDLIRMGRYVTAAQERGIDNAAGYHVLFPIPEQAMDSNSSLVQNDGY